MIGSLRGDVLERDVDGTVLVEVAGVGYLVTVSQRSVPELAAGAGCFLYVHHHIREDTQQLFGFLSSTEKSTFQTLISTHGVGPALAMAILATHPPAALVEIIANQDVGGLTLVPGVGKKTAERLLVELKSKLSVPVIEGAGAPNGSIVSDVREALAGLGYGEAEVRETLAELPAADDSADLLRDALKALAARRA